MKEEDDRKALYIAIPTIAVFAGLLYYFVYVPNKSAPAVSNNSIPVTVAENSATDTSASA